MACCHTNQYLGMVSSTESGQGCGCHAGCDSAPVDEGCAQELPAVLLGVLSQPPWVFISVVPDNHGHSCTTVTTYRPSI